jgi:hypothetical protein
MTECALQSAIEHMNTNVEKPLDGIPVPSHLLFLEVVNEVINEVINGK